MVLFSKDKEQQHDGSRPRFVALSRVEGPLLQNGHVSITWRQPGALSRLAPAARPSPPKTEGQFAPFSRSMVGKLRRRCGPVATRRRHFSLLLVLCLVVPVPALAGKERATTSPMRTRVDNVAVVAVRAAPGRLPARGGSVAVFGRVRGATECQLRLVSSQSFPVFYSSNRRDCSCGAFAAEGYDRFQQYARAAGSGTCSGGEEGRLGSPGSLLRPARRRYWRPAHDSRRSLNCAVCAANGHPELELVRIRRHRRAVQRGERDLHGPRHRPRDALRRPSERVGRHRRASAAAPRSSRQAYASTPTLRTNRASTSNPGGRSCRMPTRISQL